MSHLFVLGMTENGLTLEELSDQTGVEPRTLRSWISEGLLAAPFKPGRGARYPESNALRALAVKALKDVHGQSLSEIRKHLMLADEEQINRWASEVPASGSRTSTAREYLSRIRGRAVSSEILSEAMSAKMAAKLPSAKADRSKTMRSMERESKQPDIFDTNPKMPRRRSTHANAAELANIERLLAALEVEVRSLPPKKSRAQFWNRIRVTPDIELSVRGELRPRERAMFEQLADLIRTILTSGGAENEQSR